MQSDNLSTIYTIIYNEQDGKARIDSFLAQKISELSRTKIQKLIESGALRVNDKVVKEFNIKLCEGDALNLEIPQKQNFVLSPHREINFEIIFEDDELMVINKPAGLTVHPGAGNHSDTLVNALIGSHQGQLSTVGGPQRPGIVHRLDKDTSGLMVIAKNDEAHYILSSMLAERSIKRTYLVLVYGMLNPSFGTIKTQYGRSKRDPKKMCVMRAGGRTAITHYKTLEIFADGALSLVECSLETGRTHQIRVHMDHAGHPIIGDQTYGKGKNFNLNNLSIEQITLVKKFGRQALHAYKLAFSHPKTGEEMTFTCEPSADMDLLLKGLL
ncbi:MAG: pseudouridylate synthase, RNA-specific [Candidatus Midichloriaceae bacterium]|jgi:23S rRNA pseudouridine1911/1915/1917 synthase|nr:pseudouridylate synthase, RNA-specific [Candidatus Midichloriaceae bacterium]